MEGSRDGLKDLFFALLDQPPDKRAAFLAASNADPALRREVQVLLDSHDRAGNFLEASPLGPVVPGTTLSAGQLLGPYEIIDLIGTGGMGEIYRATDTRLGRQIAIKVLPPGFSHDKGRKRRFEEEARAASALNHPNVLTVYDVGTLNAEDGSAFIVMELLHGETLRSRLAREPALSRELVIDYGAQIARGLAAAHSAGIVHRDLKPDNLFLTSDGRLKILDFGIAKLTRPQSSSTTATLAGGMLGTVSYMDPERAQGQRADARSDIFSYGAVLLEMITRRRAFQEDSAADTLNAILNTDPLAGVEAGRDPALFGVVRRCLAKEPSDRFQNAADVAAALEDAGRRPPRNMSPRAVVGLIAAVVSRGWARWRPRD